MLWLECSIRSYNGSQDYLQFYVDSANMLQIAIAYEDVHRKKNVLYQQPVQLVHIQHFIRSAVSFLNKETEELKLAHVTFYYHPVHGSIMCKLFNTQSLTAEKYDVRSPSGKYVLDALLENCKYYIRHYL